MKLALTVYSGWLALAGYFLATLPGCDMPEAPDVVFAESDIIDGEGPNDEDGTTEAFAECPEDSQVVSGGCACGFPNARLYYSVAENNGWRCKCENVGVIDKAYAQAFCLSNGKKLGGGGGTK